MKYIILSLIYIASSISIRAQFVTNTGIQIINSATLTTNGDWQNSGTIRNNGTIITTEAWQNSGTMDFNSTGGFVFQFDSIQSFSAGSNSARIGFIQKEGVGDVTITGRVTVKDSLKILAGIIKMNTGADTLGITSTTLVSAANGSYVEGPMARFGAGSFTLPLGLGGNYLPIKFYNSTSARVGAVVKNAPAGHTNGDAVESLFGFPYVWKTTKANASDTARFVEVQSPDVLLGLDNIIVTRKTSGLNAYEAMGTKSSTAVGGSTSYKSYDRGLEGVFSLGVGYSGDPLTDSTELVLLYNTTDGENNWINNTNWTQTEVVTWRGITQKGGRVTAIDLANNGLQGNIPQTLTNLSALKSFDISGNWVEGQSNGVGSIPDMTGMPALTTVDVSGNNLNFESLEMNSSLIVGDIGFYEEQAPLTDSVYDESLAGDPYLIELPAPVGGTPANTTYQWKFKPYFGGTNYINAPGVSNQESYTVTSLNRSTIGKYKVEVQNIAVPGLLLSSDVFEVEAVADIYDTLTFNGTGVQRTNRPTEFKEMKLLQITSGGYDTIRFDANGVRVRNPVGNEPLGVNVASNGSGRFDFKEVLLRDYIINGFADPLITQYDKAIPTWYAQTFLWEEADTLVLISDTTNIDIVSTIRPDPPTTGQGSITGTFFETIDEGGRIQAKSRVSGSGVTARRVQQSGRGAAEILTLVDYKFTDENGEFEFTFLDENEYRLNLQYPGYPMDEESYITIPVVNNLFARQVAVEAEVIAGKIFVRKLIITGWEEEVHSMRAYPNPTVEYLYITGEQNQSLRFRMFNSNGAQLEVQYTWNEERKQYEVDVRELKPGVYILKVDKGNRSETLRVVVN